MNDDEGDVPLPPESAPAELVEYVQEFVDAIATGYQLGPTEKSFVVSLALCVTPAALQPLIGRLRLLHRPEVVQALELALREVAYAVNEEPFTLLAHSTNLIAEHVPYAAQVAVAWLRGRAAEAAGLALDAEALFEGARGLDPNWPPVLYSLASIANERGDAERGISLLRRAGARPEDGLLQLLLTYRSGAVLQLRRNDPCWCGSGHKLKHCHRDPPGLPLTQRASWLFHKASLFSQDGPWREEFIELATERSRYRTGPMAVYEAIADPVVVSAMLFEGLVLDDYIESRGPLLPADELELAREWTRCERSLWQIEDLQPGVGMVVRDVRRGGSLFVHEVLGSQDTKVGMLFVSLVLPVGDDRHAFFGGIEPIGLDQRDECIALFDDLPEPIDVVEFLTRRYAPMRFTTTTGEAMEPSETVLRIGGRKSIVGTFDQEFSKSGKGMWTVGTDGQALGEGDTIGAQISVSGRQVTINTMSAQRMDMMLARLSNLGYAYEVISESVIDIAAEMARLREQGEADGPVQAKPSVIDQADPDVAEFLNSYIRKYEQEWLDEHIPALGDFTPRECAADPTRRGDLIALLNSFPEGDTNMMSPNRIRTMLGL